MRLRVRFQYNETTGKVETFQVDAVTDGERAADHDRVHDQIAADLAGVVERDAGIDREPPAGPRGDRHHTPLTAPSPDTRHQRQALPPETISG